jgi:hypothetical protein
MEYFLDICGPDNKTIKAFSAPVPFLAIRVGDLLDTKQWGASQWPLLRVLNVEHAISENTAVGIDPAGRITHRVLVYTESVPDTAESRRKSG